MLDIKVIKLCSYIDRKKDIWIEQQIKGLKTELFGNIHTTIQCKNIHMTSLHTNDELRTAIE